MLLEQENLKKQRKVSIIKHIKEYMKPERLIISQQSRWKAIFDTSIIIVIAYSCFTTVFYVAFSA